MEKFDVKRSLKIWVVAAFFFLVRTSTLQFISHLLALPAWSPGVLRLQPLVWNWHLCSHMQMSSFSQERASGFVVWMMPCLLLPYNVLWLGVPLCLPWLLRPQPGSVRRCHLPEPSFPKSLPCWAREGNITAAGPPANFWAHLHCCSMCGKAVRVGQAGLIDCPALEIMRPECIMTEVGCLWLSQMTLFHVTLCWLRSQLHTVRRLVWLVAHTWLESALFWTWRETAWFGSGAGGEQHFGQTFQICQWLQTPQPALYLKALPVHKNYCHQLCVNDSLIWNTQCVDFLPGSWV